MSIVEGMNVQSTPTARRVAEAMRRAQNQQLRDAALILAHAGVPVFPCAPYGKQPLTRSGFLAATTDPRQVGRWWLRSPSANIGMPTGTTSGVVVVDVDVHATGNGFSAFARTERAGITSQWSFLVRTPSGGIHAYFTPAGEDQRNWQANGTHVDFRGEGGYVVIPPSQIRGPGDNTRSYELIAIAQHGDKALDADRLRDFLVPPRQVREPVGMPARGARPDRLVAWMANRPEGTRNSSLFWAACRMVEDGQRYDATLSVLGDAARSAGLGEHEVESTIRSAYRIASRLGPGSRLGPTQARTATASSEAVAL
ncbi:bifunctional DNA primase/polymerase-like protein [Nocardioides albertanoniae]|uniref:Bifunctional DNA primase/polymerase-like protein n=2 Tax=Nocardioides TaxID=1839 RepID=A0A543A8C3_9ACTN|nr:bifunctional DNA primase/polymerase-like protein [Nocardioides albertanoniae]